MATTTVLAPRDVSTTLNYYTPIGSEPPYRYSKMKPLAGRLVHNLGKDVQQVVVSDARGREQEFSLDRNGFQFLRWPSAAEESFGNHKRIRTEYYPEVEQLLKTVTGARRVRIFNHIVRCPLGKGPGNPKRMRTSRPAERVHADQTFWQGARYVNRYFPTEAEMLLKDRVRIINVWRPIRHTVAHHPLGVSDWRYFDEDDFVAVRRFRAGRNDGEGGGSYIFRYNPAHKWYYLSSQTPDEVILIKCYDSAVDQARCSPHSAFVDANSPKEAPERVSIEVRALLFDVE